MLGSDKPELKDVKINQGTTPADIKRTLKIPKEYDVYQRSRDEFLKDDTDLYAIMSEGEKLEFHPHSDLGSGREEIIFPSSSLFNKKELSIIIPEIKPESVTIDLIPMIQHIPMQIIKPAEKIGLEAQLQNIGWRSQDKDFFGEVHGKFKSYKCKLKWKGRGYYELLIKNPSTKLLSGRHGSCLLSRGGKWYYVHFVFNKNPITMIAKLQKYIKDIGG